MTCHACATSPEPAQGCKGCRAQALGRLFLAKGERGKAFRRACEQLGVTEDQVQRAWASDPSNPEHKPEKGGV